MKKYENYVSALNSLRKAPEQDLGNDFIQSGIIDKFGLQFELGWKLFKALLAYEGDPVSASGSPRDVLKTAFQYYDFMDESLWLRMLRPDVYLEVQHPCWSCKSISSSANASAGVR